VPGYVPASLLEGGFVFARTGVLYRVTLVQGTGRRWHSERGWPPAVRLCITGRDFPSGIAPAACPFR